MQKNSANKCHTPIKRPIPTDMYVKRYCSHLCTLNNRLQCNLNQIPRSLYPHGYTKVSSMHLNILRLLLCALYLCSINLNIKESFNNFRPLLSLFRSPTTTPEGLELINLNSRHITNQIKFDFKQK